MLEQEKAFKGEDVVRFLKHLMRQIPGQAARDLGRLSDTSGRGGKGLSGERGVPRRLKLEQLPGYAPDLNPDEGIWKHLKCMWS